MKKIFLCAAAVAMLGLAACSNKQADADTATIDTPQNDTIVMVSDSVSVESLNKDSVQVTEQVEAAEVVTPAAN